MSEIVGQASFEVPFFDVDALRIVWHGNYLKYFELARTALFRKVGLDASDLEAAGHHFVVVESRVRHTRPLRLGDQVTVEARFLAGEPRVTVVYRVRNASRGEIAARGRTSLALIDTTSGTMIDVPDELRKRLHA